MLSQTEFLKIIKKTYNKFFTTKQAIEECILSQNPDLSYLDFKYNQHSLSKEIKECRRYVTSILKDLEEKGIIVAWNQRRNTWQIKGVK